MGFQTRQIRTGKHKGGDLINMTETFWKYSAWWLLYPPSYSGRWWCRQCWLLFALSCSGPKDLDSASRLSWMSVASFPEQLATLPIVELFCSAWIKPQCPKGFSFPDGNKGLRAGLCTAVGSTKAALASLWPWATRAKHKVKHRRADCSTKWNLLGNLFRK